MPGDSPALHMRGESISCAFIIQFYRQSVHSPSDATSISNHVSRKSPLVDQYSDYMLLFTGPPVSSFFVQKGEIYFLHFSLFHSTFCHKSPDTAVFIVPEPLFSDFLLNERCFSFFLSPLSTASPQPKKFYTVILPLPDFPEFAFRWLFFYNGITNFRQVFYG